MSLLGYASTGSWPAVVALAFVAGLGAGGIDTGINTYAATRHGPRMLNWMHACYGIGAAGGPVILTAVLSAGGPWRRAYVIVGAAQLALAATFVTTLRAWPASPRSDPRAVGNAPASISATLRLPVMRWSIGLFFAYTGLELAVGAWTYTLLTEGRGVSTMAAGSSASLFWAALTGGRVLGAAVASRVPAGVLVRRCLLLVGVGLALLAAGLAPALDVVGLVAAGAAAGPVFPTLIASTPARVGTAHADNAIGFQIAAAALGQSLIPSLLGVVGDGLGLDALAAGLVAAGIVVLIAHRGVESTRSAPDRPRADLGPSAPNPAHVTALLGASTPRADPTARSAVSRNAFRRPASNRAEDRLHPGR
jgi:fucose permease